ncbi:PLP-dependent cysteine synthase family protein [Candidimonas sp. SYP-B2681]|uniref:PLP-dependent cysteine synthase family protein n=1 Tax=Candidimonas sp. SYP-B2681 TaxID=2497686 RepID=UPI000F8997A2|nr:PLP-dependent cysteine synthase family protein [Candidimonas sp. SYP-B2681]RTZ43370.1 PLP-dependent cysteine synthase family protein [Candidimonas sp. SYP-B2681]
MTQQKWVQQAVSKIEADFNRSADTHLIPVPLPAYPGVQLYLKDESSHPTGSLKHRLARSLFLYALCNGWLNEHSTVIEASSGSTAVSEAYFARLIGLPFVAVIPRSTSVEKIAAIEFYGGHCHLVDKSHEIYGESERLARELGGHYMDQFTYAERATDWRSNNNIAESIFNQMRQEQHPIPAWVVCSCGTGGTTATIGRYIRYRGYDTRVCVADPENSVFFDAYASGDVNLSHEQGSRIEGIGRPRVEKSFIPSVIDCMVKVPDLASLAALRYLHNSLGRRSGGSTGTNFIAVLHLARQMHEAGQTGSIVTILCDSGERYMGTYYDDAWLQSQQLDIAPALEALTACADRGDAMPWQLAESMRSTNAFTHR